MNTGRLARICVVLCSAAVIGAVPSTASSATSATQSAVVPSFAHVVVVVMENKSASSIIGNTSQASYINGLAAQYSYASNDFAVSHQGHGWAAGLILSKVLTGARNGLEILAGKHGHDLLGDYLMLES